MGVGFSHGVHGRSGDKSNQVCDGVFWACLPSTLEPQRWTPSVSSLNWRSPSFVLRTMSKRLPKPVRKQTGLSSVDRCRLAVAVKAASIGFKCGRISHDQAGRDHRLDLDKRTSLAVNTRSLYDLSKFQASATGSTHRQSDRGSGSPASGSAGLRGMFKD